MNGPDRTNHELLAELAALRGRVAELEAVELQLERERARAQEYVNIAGVILLALDARGHIETLNRRGHQLLGYPEGELIGRSWFDFVPADARERVETVFRQLMAGEIELTEFYENDVLTRAGNRRTIAWHNSLLSNANGLPVGTLSSGTDVTDQNLSRAALKQAHDELEQRVRQRTAELTSANARLSREAEERGKAEEQLQVIYDGMVDGLLIADIATKRFAHANSSIGRMLGYTVDELLTMSVMDIHPPADVPRVLGVFTAKADQPTIMTDALPFRRKDGSVFYADVTASRIVYNGANCLMGFFRDITERKEARERLQREHRLLRELLKSQDRERQLIAYEIHDGLAQQLVGAIMQIESIPSLFAGDLEGVKASCDAGLHMLRKSLAEARRLIGGLRPPILDELGVVAAVGHVVHELSAEGWPEIEYECQVEFDRLEPALENTIYRIAQECLRNAERYSQSEKIRIALTQTGPRLRMEVTDWGIGFDSTVEREGCFGLEGIKERARLLGGSATIGSVPGKGTQIVVELPLAEIS